MNEENLLLNKDMREGAIKNIYVLEKVKKLLLLPGDEFATTKQVADYYEIPVSTLKTLIRDNKEELEFNGFIKYKKDDILRKVFNQSFVKHERTRAIALVGDEEIIINNTGLNLFTKRTILNVGMLLRDSIIAKQVRKTLLDIIQDVEKKSPDIIKSNLDHLTNIQQVQFKIVEAFSKGDTNNMMKYTMELQQLNSKEVETLEKKVTVLNHEIDIFSDNIIKWDKQPVINKIVRCIGATIYLKHTKGKLSIAIARAWDKLYGEVMYRHGIGIRSRITKREELTGKKLTMFDVLDDSEIILVLQSAISLCKKTFRGIVNIDEILSQQELKDIQYI